MIEKIRSIICFEQLDLPVLIFLDEMSYPADPLADSDSEALQAALLVPCQSFLRA
jgi:hypothetical protein